MQTLFLAILLFHLGITIFDTAFTGSSVGMKTPIAEEIIRSGEGLAQSVSSISFTNPFTIISGIGSTLVGGLALTLTLVKGIVRILLVDHAIFADGFMVYIRWGLVTITGAVFLIVILPIMRGGRI